MNSITNNKEQIEVILINYSTNDKITAGMNKDAAGKISRGWKQETVKWNEQELTELVRTKAYICSKLKDGHKKAENVEEVYFFALDFDNDDKRNQQESITKKFKYLSKDNFIKDAAKWKFSWFLHTTVSHNTTTLEDGNPRNKYRVLIPFTKPVNDSLVRNELKELWLKKFPDLDSTSFQGERYYMISPNAEVYLFNKLDENGNIIFFDPDSIETNKSKAAATKSKGRPKINNEVFPLSLEVTLADGETKKQIHEVESHTPIFCPYCIHDKEHRGNPDKANAFVDINSVGYYYIYCSSENKTYWPNPKDLLTKNVKLFWNTKIGAPAQTDYIQPEDIDEDSPPTTVNVFKNNDDFKNFCNNEGISYSIKEYLVRAGLIFNPKRPSGLHGPVYNLFEETRYMKKDYRQLPRIPLSAVVNELKQRTPTIYEIFKNLFDDDDIVMRFINWNAFLLQKREKAQTAWLIQSEEQGVGKDFMFNFILKPIFGEKQSQLLNGSRIGKQFNSLDLNCFLRGYNEVFTNKDSTTNNFRKEWLKDRITGETHEIEFKGVDSYVAKNHMNFILFSNNDLPMILDQKDRRYNVVKNDNAKKVKQLSFFTCEDDLPPLIEKELPSFADILFTLMFDRGLANTPMETAAKEKLMNLSADEYDKFVDALRNGDSDYFLLDEIFKSDKSDELFSLSSDGVVWSARAKEAKRIINEHRVILAADMNAIIKFFFPKYAYREVLNKFKQRKLINKQKRFAELGNPKVYIIDETEV